MARRPDTRQYLMSKQLEQEDSILDAIERKDLSIEFQKLMADVLAGKRDVPDLIAAAAVPAVAELMTQLLTGDAKSRRAAAESFLDRAGHSKVQKVHSINATLKPGTDPNLIMSAVKGLLTKNRVGKVVNTTITDDKNVCKTSEGRKSEDIRPFDAKRDRL